jgi:hypothetical protein
MEVVKVNVFDTLSNRLPGLRFSNFKTLLSLSLTSTFIIKNSARREKCDSRFWWISALVPKKCLIVLNYSFGVKKYNCGSFVKFCSLQNFIFHACFVFNIWSWIFCYSIPLVSFLLYSLCPPLFFLSLFTISFFFSCISFFLPQDTSK